MPTTARPLVVFSAIAYCDSAAEHEHRIISNGESAYAYSPNGEEPVGVHRDGTLLSIACTQPDRRDATASCFGRLEWRLDEPGSWTSDADAITLLVAHGKPVER